MSISSSCFHHHHHHHRIFYSGLSIKNTTRTTVREARQSSDDTYVRIAAVEQNCLQALSEHRQWWSGGHIRRQTIPDVGTGDWEGPRSDSRQAVWRHNELVGRRRSQPATCGHISDTSELRRQIRWCSAMYCSICQWRFQHKLNECGAEIRAGVASPLFSRKGWIDD